nr:hypothetical protein [Rhodococcus sp. MSC1_016]
MTADSIGERRIRCSRFAAAARPDRAFTGITRASDRPGLLHPWKILSAIGACEGIEQTGTSLVE